MEQLQWWRRGAQVRRKERGKEVQHSAPMGQRTHHEPQSPHPHQHTVLTLLQGESLRTKDLPRGYR